MCYIHIPPLAGSRPGRLFQLHVRSLNFTLSLVNEATYVPLLDPRLPPLQDSLSN